MMKNSIAALLCFICLTFFQQGMAAPEAPALKAVQEFTLSNGLKLIVKQDNRAPVVISQIWYRVGSANEDGGISGISHVLEHLMFKGTHKHPQGEFSRIIAELGGEENAFTSRDYTSYYQKLAPQHLATSLALEADRMHNLNLPDDAFTKEIEVVKEERRMRVDDNPNSTTMERFSAAAHLAHPYHHLPIGWMQDLLNLTNQDVKDYYKKWYAPNNAVLVIVGAVNPEQTYQMVKKYFGPIPAKELPKLKVYREPPALGERRLTVHAPAELPLLMIGYNVPSLKTCDKPWEAYALEVLGGILDAGNSSRIAKHYLRGKQILASGEVDYDLYSQFGGLFSLNAIPAKGHTIDEIEKALLQELHSLTENPVSEKELKRVKAQIAASHVFAKDSLFGQAMQIGRLESVGLSWREDDAYILKINAITAQQVRQVAKKYLTDKRRTVARLKPTSLKKSAKPTAPAGE